VIVGAEDPRAIEVLRDLYRGILRTNDRIQVNGRRLRRADEVRGERDARDAHQLHDELARLCEVIGADIEAVRKGIGSDPRIGNKFLFAGCGFGGSCFPKDLRALRFTADSVDVPLGVVEAVERANERQKRVLGERVLAHFGGSLAGKRIAIWGLAFKPETDDIRESPALVLLEQLRSAGATVSAMTPRRWRTSRRRAWSSSSRRMLRGRRGSRRGRARHEWHELRDPDLDRLKATMRTHVLVDGRNVWPGAEARALGFTYYGIGRP